MRAMQRRLVFLLALLSTLANAEVIAVYQIDQSKGEFVQAPLYYDIYRYSNSPHLTDLQVIDAKGNKLPHRVTSVKPATSVQSRELPLRFFPVAVGAAPETLLALSSASIRLDDNEISVSVEKIDRSQLQDTSSPIDFFLIDVSENKEPIGALKIDWQPEQSNQYLQVEASGTNDLTNWNNIIKTSLVQLQKNGQHLTRNIIPINLAPTQYAYLRLKFTGAGDQFTPSNVVASNTEANTKMPTAERWEVKGELAEEQTSVMRSASITYPQVAAWEFSREDIAPLDGISLRLGEVMYGESVRVFSREKENQEWRLVHDGIWFNIQVGASWQQSDDIFVNDNSDMFWRVELNESIRSSAQPGLVFSRQPELLQFVASANPPFQIAIETDSQKISNDANHHIFSEVTAKTDIRWTDAEVTHLSPDVSKFARHGFAMSWKTVLFWALLLVAVALLIFVALRLAKQVTSMEKDAPAS